MMLACIIFEVRSTSSDKHQTHRAFWRPARITYWASSLNHVWNRPLQHCNIVSADLLIGTVVDSFRGQQCES
jgi:hypothetical protein